jgi:hypothetical protein
MPSVVFVHGTSVREKRFEADSELVSQKIKETLPGAEVIAALWGDLHGSRLHFEGKSIPDYKETGGKATAVDEFYVNLWNYLFWDPIYELRLRTVELESQDQQTPGVGGGDLLDSQLQSIDVEQHAALKSKLDQARIREYFVKAREKVRRTPSYTALLNIVPGPTVPGDYRMALARAVVAQAIVLGGAERKWVPIREDAELRNEVVNLLTEVMGGTTMGAFESLGRFGLNLFDTLALQPRRGLITDYLLSFVGDVLLYQSQGELIRRAIADHISRADGPVVLVGHSLGGIASVDLLMKQSLPNVKLLVTVGSQAPLLYELGALHSRPTAAPPQRFLDWCNTALPTHFPDWLNIWDARDYLSFVTESVFSRSGEDSGNKGAAQKILRDTEVNNQAPFLTAHSSYWSNKQVWGAVKRAWDEIEQRG